MATPLREIIQFLWRMQTDSIHYRHLLLLSPKADAHITDSWRMEGWVNVGSKGVQTVPKAVYHSGCRDKHTAHGEITDTRGKGSQAVQQHNTIRDTRLTASFPRQPG